MTLSILHRITGMVLAVGFIAFAVWLEAIAFQAVSYDAYRVAMESAVGQLMLIGWLFCFFIHLSNGVRHLIWDTGRLFEKRQADLSGWLVLIASVVMTAAYRIIV
jgi:succinate dehydrogenase / fumarate reductase, cytochrome b subunit